MLAPKIEYIDQSYKVDLSPVRKQIWNGTEFVPLNLYRLTHKLGEKVYEWLEDTYGPPGQYINGCYWNRLTDRWTLMDEKVYMFYKLKWVRR